MKRLAIIISLFLFFATSGRAVLIEQTPVRKTKGTASLVVAASDAPADVIAIADYTCNGTDDDIQKQAAIDEAFADGGGTVHLSAGTFYTTAAVDMKSGVSVEGQGPDATIIEEAIASIDADKYMFTFTNADHAVLSNVRIDGATKATNNNAHGGVYVSGTAKNSKIENCFITQFNGTGASEGQDGVYFDTGSTPTDFTISRCLISNVKDDGVDSNAAIGLRIEFNKFVACLDCGIDSDGMVRSFIIGNLFQNCDLEGGGAGADSGVIEFEDGSNDNIAAYNTIYLTGDLGDDDEYAIYISNSNNNTVTSNLILGVQDGIGVYLKNDADDNTVTDNLLKDCSVAGIKNDSGCERNQLFPNLFLNCTSNYAIADNTSHTFEIIDSDWIPTSDDKIDIGSEAKQVKDIHVTGTANIDSLVADTADINAGTFDGVVGGTTPAAGTFTNTGIAGSTPAAGKGIYDNSTQTASYASIDIALLADPGAAAQSYKAMSFALNATGSENITALRGADGTIVILNDPGYSGTISTAAGLSASIMNLSAGTITNAYGLNISNVADAGAGSIGTAYGIYIADIATAGTNYAMYSAGGDTYLVGDISANDVTDRTPAFAGTSAEALAQVLNVKSTDGQIDHASLPSMARVTAKKQERYNYRIEDGVEVYDERTIEEEGRSLSGMVTVLTEAVKELTKQVEELKKQ